MSPARHGNASRREQFRAATVEEIKQTALRLIRDRGAANIRFSDIAKAMRITAPALYWYFPDRAALLNALIADAGAAVRQRVAHALDATDNEDIAGRWRAVANAYRQWAREEPQQFALIREQRVLVPLTSPTRDSASATENHTENQEDPTDDPASGSEPTMPATSGPVTDAADRALTQMATAFTRASQAGQLAPPLEREVGTGLAACARQTTQRLDIDLPADTFQAMLHAWTSLHGFISLETCGHLDWMTQHARDDLFDSQIRLAAHTAGLPIDS